MESLKKLIAIKYGIDVSEEIKTLGVKLPYCGEMEGCKNLKYSGGLFTQCCKDSDGDFCKVCKSEINREGSKYGTTEDRKRYNLGEFVSKTGKVEVDYIKYMKQHGYTKEMVLNAAKVREIKIPDEIFKEKKNEKMVKRDVVVEDSDSEKSVEVKRGRGRPRKERKEIIIEEDKEEERREEEDKKEEEREEEEDKKEEEREEEDKEEEEDREEDSDSDEEIEVRKFKLDGKEYLKDVKNNKIYNKEGECLGIYNKKSNKIDLIID